MLRVSLGALLSRHLKPNSNPLMVIGVGSDAGLWGVGWGIHKLLIDQCTYLSIVASTIAAPSGLLRDCGFSQSIFLTET